ncbi:MAG: GNAT family protein [Rikenellaceae bacterium]
MINLRGDRVVLRAVEPEDIDLMYGVENDLHNWSVSGTNMPFSRYILEQFVEVQRSDIFVSRQLRLMVEDLKGEVVGMVDLFEIDPYNHRAGVGILIFDSFRRLGYGVDVLRRLHLYCRGELQLHQLWCDVGAENLASLKLFAKVGYTEVGRKRDWQYRDAKYQDEILLQKILEV